MEKGNKYHVLAMKDRQAHLDNYDMLCGTMKINGISEDTPSQSLLGMIARVLSFQISSLLPGLHESQWDLLLSVEDSLLKHGRGLRVTPCNTLIMVSEKRAYWVHCNEESCSIKYRNMLDTTSNGNF